MRIFGETAFTGELDQAVDLTSEPDRVGRRTHPALESEQRVGRVPASVDPTEDIGLRGPGIGEEDSLNAVYPAALRIGRTSIPG